MCLSATRDDLSEYRGAFIENLQGRGVPCKLVFQAADSVTGEIALWQDRPLDEAYPIVSVDGLKVCGSEPLTLTHDSVLAVKPWMST